MNNIIISMVRGRGIVLPIRNNVDCVEKEEVRGGERGKEKGKKPLSVVGVTPSVRKLEPKRAFKKVLLPLKKILSENWRSRKDNNTTPPVTNLLYSPTVTSKNKLWS